MSDETRALYQAFLGFTFLGILMNFAILIGHTLVRPEIIEIFNHSLQVPAPPREALEIPRGGQRWALVLILTGHGLLFLVLSVLLYWGALIILPPTPQIYRQISLVWVIMVASGGITNMVFSFGAQLYAQTNLEARALFLPSILTTTVPPFFASLHFLYVMVISAWYQTLPRLWIFALLGMAVLGVFLGMLAFSYNAPPVYLLLPSIGSSLQAMIIAIYCYLRLEAQEELE